MDRQEAAAAFIRLDTGHRNLQVKKDGVMDEGIFPREAITQSRIFFPLPHISIKGLRGWGFCFRILAGWMDGWSNGSGYICFLRGLFDQKPRLFFPFLVKKEGGGKRVNGVDK